MVGTLSHAIGFDDGPFDRERRGGKVAVVGAVFSGLRLEGVLCGKVRRDGSDATRTLARMVSESKFAAQLQVVLLQGIALAGFNVVDLHELHERLGVPVMTVARRRPRMIKIRSALLEGGVRGGARKWSLIESAGPMEAVAGVYVQRIGLSLEQARRLIERTAVHGSIPEPLRTAHLIAGALAAGESRGRA